MITTLTLNPAVDKTIFVHKLEVGEVNRVEDSQLDPAGKGINVSRLVYRLDWPTVALGFIAGYIGHLAQRALAEEGIHHDFVEIRGETRLNVTIMDEGKRSGTSFYDKGPEVHTQDMKIMDEKVSRWLKSSHILVLAGSLPPGVPEGTYARYIAMAKEANVKTILDTHGEPLHIGIKAGPYMIKPNVEEAEGLLGRRLPDPASVAKAARELAKDGVEVVVISMGSKGAICFAEGHTWWAKPPEIERVSTVGSGDSMVGALAIAIVRRQSMLEGLRLATAAGAATAASPGTSLGSVAEVETLIPQIVIEEIA